MDAIPLFLLCVLSICQSSNILDISDYNFYFNNFHYDLTSTQQDIALDNFHLNIDLEHLVIDVTSNNNHEPIVSLDITNDNDWNEVSLISSVDNYTTIHYEPYIAIEKALNYKEAQSYCARYYSGDLVSISSTTNHEIVSNLCDMLSDDVNHCWIGSDPKQNTNEDTTTCDVIHMNDNNQASQSKTSCNTLQSFICQRPTLLYRGAIIGVASKMSYDDAQSYCFYKFGTKLADSHDEDVLKACKDTAHEDWCWTNSKHDECMRVKEDGSMAKNAYCFESNFFLCDKYMQPQHAAHDEHKRRLINYWDDYYYDDVPAKPQSASAEEGEPYEEEQEYESAEPQAAPKVHVHHHIQHPSHPMLHPMHPMHPMHQMGMHPYHPMHHMLHPIHPMHPMNRMGMNMMHPMHPMHPMNMMGGMGMNPMMNPMMGGMSGMGMNPMMGGMMGGMGMMPGAHHVYDIHTGNTKQWRRKMKDMISMMKDMQKLNHGHMSGGCHHHYGCGQHHGMQHCVFFGTQLVCNMGYPMMPYSSWGMVGAGMMPGMTPGMMPMMGGLAPNYYGAQSGAQTAKKPIVVVHSKNGNTRVETKMVDDKTANKIKQKGTQVHRRMLEQEVDVRYVDNEMYVHEIARCRVLDMVQSVDVYEICVVYDLDEMRFSLDVIEADEKVLRGNKRRRFRVRDDRRKIYGGYDEDANADAHVFGDNYVSFEPIKGNLGYVVYKYELMDWHLLNVKDDHSKKYPYGEFDDFDDFVHYFDEFEFVYHPDKRCSEILDRLPFRLCVKMIDDGDIVLYFEREKDFVVDDNINIARDYALEMQQYIDDEFESASFRFNDKYKWDEIHAIHEGNKQKTVRKCVYLSTAKVCLSKEEDSQTITASVKSQLANKPN